MGQPPFKAKAMVRGSVEQHSPEETPQGVLSLGNIVPPGAEADTRS